MVSYIRIHPGESEAGRWSPKQRHKEQGEKHEDARIINRLEPKEGETRKGTRVENTPCWTRSRMRKDIISYPFPHDAWC